MLKIKQTYMYSLILLKIKLPFQIATVTSPTEKEI